MRKSIACSHSLASSAPSLASLFCSALLVCALAGCPGEDGEQAAVGAPELDGRHGDGPRAEGMGGEGPRAGQSRKLAPIDPGLRSDGECLWMRSCGEDSQGRSCGTCEDSNPCTLDRCVDDFTCVHDLVDQSCVCEPTCGAAAVRLLPVTRLNHASGGLPGLDGVQGIAVTADDRHVYVAATESGALTHLVRVDGTLRWAESLPLGPVVAVTVASDGKAVYASGSQGLLVLARDEAGRLTPTGQKLPAAWGLATEGPWLAAMDTRTLRLYRRGGERGTTLELIQEIEGTVVAGIRQAAFAPGGQHLYTAGFDDSVLAAWAVSDSGLEKISALKSKRGLLNVDSVAVSPDGQHVYAAGFCDHSLAILRRDPATGAVEWLGSAAPKASVQGCVPGMYAEQGGQNSRGGPFATPTSIAVSADGKTVVVTSLSTWFNVRIYKRDGDHLTMSMHLDASPSWLDYSRFDWANEEVDGEGPPMPTRPWLYRSYSQVVAGKERFYVSNGIVDAVAELDSRGGTSFVQKGDGGIGNLAGAYNMDISPDGRHVYVAPRGSSGVAVGSFASDADGHLTALPFPVKQLPALGEGAVLNVAVTRPEGRFAAVVEADYPTLYLYERDPVTGTLSPRDELPIPGCSGRPSFPVDVISTPGGHLYVADFQWQGDGCVHHFRLSEDGKLSAGKTYASPFLRGVEAIVVTSDGKHLYTACHEASMVAHFAREPGDGTLEPREPIERADLHGAEFIAISPDDRHIYATSPVEDKIVVLARDPDSGSLRHLQTVGEQPGAPLKGASGITMTADGALVFVASRTDDSITVLERAESGLLSPVGSLVDKEHLDWVNGVAVSADGRVLYTAAVQSNAINSYLIVRDREDGCGGTCP
jgi:6-phosphogluconolactonase (cycloisomerase 2 family)